MQTTMRTFIALLFSLFFVTFSFAQEIPTFQEAKTLTEVMTQMQAVFVKDSAARKAANTPEEYAATLQFLGSVEASAGKRIAEVGTSEAEKETGLKMQLSGSKRIFEGFRVLTSADLPVDEEKYKRLLEGLGNVLDELAKDEKNLPLANTERYKNFFIPKTDRLGKHFSQKEFDQYLEEAKTWTTLTPVSYKPIDPLLRMVSIAAYPPVAQAQPDLEAKTIQTLSDFVESPQLVLPEADKKTLLENWQGFLHRRPGGDLQLYGKTLDDKDFDWQSLRGKIVVVKFTASWCGPCKLVLPDIKEVYEKYHAQGLEVVSVYVRDKLADSKKAVEEEKVTWTCLSEELTIAAGQPGQNEKYAVPGVPTIAIVGRDGKVIAALPSNADRGKILREKLAEIFDKQASK